jgi:hypothetical protein
MACGYICRKLADGLFLESCRKVSKLYPDIGFNDMIVDNASMQVREQPKHHRTSGAFTMLTDRFAVKRWTSDQKVSMVDSAIIDDAEEGRATCKHY